jgi:tetratricopeptide (TPR) repeat protein
MTDLASSPSLSAWVLAEHGKYQRALDLYDEARRLGFELTPPDHANCGLYLLCLEKYEEASTQFAAANKLRDTEYRRKEGSYLNGEGVAQWLMGRRSEAVTAWRYRVSGLLSGNVHYADFAGGASDGLLLWYAAVTLKDHDLLNYTTEYFRKWSTFGHPSIWPGPLVDLALGTKSAEVIFKKRFGNMWFGWVRRSDFLRRRELVNALFYIAVKYRADGHEQECRKLMSNVVKIPNPLIEPEWYLARGELS